MVCPLKLFLNVLFGSLYFLLFSLASISIDAQISYSILATAYGILMLATMLSEKISLYFVVAVIREHLPICLKTQTLKLSHFLISV